MPTWGRSKSSVTSSPLHRTFTRFATAHGLRGGGGGGGHHYALDKCPSPAGLHPVAPSVMGHLRRLYHERTGSDAAVEKKKEEEEEGGSLLSRAAFEKFIKEVQRDGKKPSWSFSETHESFTFEQFVQFWWDEYSAAKRPIHPEDKDLDKPISNYFISSSHNTYIEDGNQITGEAKALQYQKVSCLVPASGIYVGWGGGGGRSGTLGC